MSCSIDQCSEAAYCRGWCRRHYYRWWRLGDAQAPTPPRRRPTCVRDADGRKRCTKCQTWQSEDCFTKNSKATDGYTNQCKSCEKTRRDSRVEQHRDYMRQRRYGLSASQFERKFDAQGRRCAICQTDDPGKKEWCVDHDHECCSGRATCGSCVRGILCSRCNLVLGLINDEQRLLTSASEYLMAWQPGVER